MQQSLNPQQIVADPKSDFSGGIQQDASYHGQWHSKSEVASNVSGGLPLDQTMQDDFHHRLTGQAGAQPNNLSSEESPNGQSDPSRSQPLNTSEALCRSSNITRERQFRNQQRWLLFLRHARRCPAPEGKCHDPHCLTVQKLLKHMECCDVFQCTYPRCRATRVLINHHRRCRDANCPVCVPVKDFVQAQLKAFARSDLNSGLPSSVNGSCNSLDTAEIGQSTAKMDQMAAETPEDLQPPLKRIKVEQYHQILVPESERTVALASNINDYHVQEQHNEQRHDSHIPMKSETTEVKMEVPGSVAFGQLSPKNTEMKDNLDDVCIQSPKGGPIAANNPAGFAGQEVIKTDKEMGQAKLENTSAPSGNASKSGKPKIKGVSMIELFTPEQVREHIMGLRQWVGQSKAKAERNQAMEHSMSENSCQLCAVEKLTFETPPIYCTPCGARIKRNAMYYTIGAGETRHCFCIPCYNDARGDTIVVDGATLPKARAEKKKNDEEIEEWWVQCDKCEAWQHQICALFNGRRNDGGQAEYTCPNCYMAEVERGERVPLPQSAVLGAKDLPRTNLSDHLEQRLFAKLKHERHDRARLQGKSYDEVPGAEALVVRVVSSVDKKLDVKPRFLEIFQEENYPIEFHKSKGWQFQPEPGKPAPDPPRMGRVWDAIFGFGAGLGQLKPARPGPGRLRVILLFQRIEGVEVCLFGMYVQEFGSECQQPNHRRVYLSYLDSVKYFRPDVRAVTGEALRTFVYHEILASSDFVVLAWLLQLMRGFTSCYIWACPPLKGEDYILYCHPEIQKTPKSDKLREWYLCMLRKAAKENIVVDLTNLYEHFFISTGECKAKVTAARLPYFDGDYWPGAAEDILYQLQQEEDGKKQHKKGFMKKSITKRALKASGQTDLSSNASKDLMLMHKLGETISPMKEDFIMVHLQHACSHCCILMVSGNRWSCKQCKNFQLCDKSTIQISFVVCDDLFTCKHLSDLVMLCFGSVYNCYDAEQKREHRDRHPANQKDKHALYPVEITGVPDDTRDNEILESEFFDTRQAFLSLCQGNHYQYDTLRRAKHSSMMKLGMVGDAIHALIMMYAMLVMRRMEEEIILKLSNNQSNDHDAQNKEARQLRVMQLRKMLDLLVHASQCRSPHCQYPNCRKVKGLFRHGMLCKVRASGGCHLCKKMWYLLQLHARACKESQCTVPRCRDLKEHMRRLQQQSDSRRRAAVMEMMRQRAAEVAGNS
ncbi:Histone acetyltransferase HAC1 [Sesamum angolense]|uniref:histone acetyltransferase n=1 Tax=Sesamum angolense TaxID=2727404 RepID=A0AAE1WR92_9LAMI|nr:Histone acetyltransferase HAC1 [Sesamum angolense]